MKTLNERKNKKISTAKELTSIALFVALLIGAQTVLSAVAGLEIVSLLLACYAFVYGAKRGAVCAVAFALLRQIVFGVFVSVLILYLVYYPLFACAFGWLGKRMKTPFSAFVSALLLACICTALFTLLDDIITPLFYQFDWTATKSYFYASLPIMAIQTVSVGVVTAVGFLPICRALVVAKRNLS